MSSDIAVNLPSTALLGEGELINEIIENAEESARVNELGEVLNVNSACNSLGRIMVAENDLPPYYEAGFDKDVSTYENMGMDDDDVEIDELEYEEDNPDSLLLATEKLETSRSEMDESTTTGGYETNFVSNILDLPSSSPPNFIGEYPSSSPPCYTQEHFDTTESTSKSPIPSGARVHILEGLSSSPPLPPYTSSPYQDEEELKLGLPLSSHNPDELDVLSSSANIGVAAEEHIIDNFSEDKDTYEEKLPSQAASKEDGSGDIHVAEDVVDHISQPEVGPVVPQISASVEEHHTSDTRGEEFLQPSLPIIRMDREEGNLTKKRSIENAGIKESPAPKRMTLESRRRQHQKLSTPFRSPLLQKPDLPDSQTHSAASPDADVFSTRSIHQETRAQTPQTPILTRTDKVPSPSITPSSAKFAQSKFKSLLQSTPKAASQFKSPLSSSANTSQPSSFRSGTSSTIKSLEAQLQTLKRAIQLKESKEAEKLEALIKQWHDAGREVAWDLWAFVREQTSEDTGSYDSNYPGTNTKSTSDGQGFQSGWGWADGLSNSNRSWGWDNVGETNSEEEEVNSQELMSPSKLEASLYKALSQKSGVRRQSILPPTPRGAYYEQQRFAAHDDDTHGLSKSDLGEGGVSDEEGCPSTATTTAHANTLGGMLTRLGIAHSTLGWSEDEGDFVDA